MYVYKPVKGINSDTSVLPRLQATQPQDATENPVSVRMPGGQFGAIYFTRGAAAAENSVNGMPGTNHGTYVVFAHGSTTAALLLTYTIERGGNRVSRNNTIAFIKQG